MLDITLIPPVDLTACMNAMIVVFGVDAESNQRRKRKMILNYITLYLPAFVGVIYFIVGAAYVLKKDFAWAAVWWGYAIAQAGLVIAGNK
jgi:hypothetical protein